MGEDNNEFSITIGSSEYASDWDSSSITYSLPEPSSTTITLDTIDTSFVNDTGSEYTFNVGKTASTVFVDSMPSVHRIQEMCELYPALAKAYEQFKLIYKMTEQDYKGKLKERGIDDDIPF